MHSLGWIELAAIPNKEASTVAQSFVSSWICRHGCPESVFSDLGSEFTSDIFTELCQKFDIQINYATAGHPESNGKVERVNRTLLTYLRKYLSTEIQWPDQLAYAAFSHNSATHSSTGTSPYFVLYLNYPRVPHQCIIPDKDTRPFYSELAKDILPQRLIATYRQVSKANEKSFAKQKLAHDKRAKTKTFQYGDRVYLRDSGEADRGRKVRSLYSGPYFISQALRNNNYQLRKQNSPKLIVVHANRLKLIPFSAHPSVQASAPPNVDDQVTEAPTPPPQEDDGKFSDGDDTRPIQRRRLRTRAQYRAANDIPVADALPPRI